jgi:17beta-estradiol 17-dehydrogenase / very-long-chain 3-oxoacyl-CoA reductase
MSKIRKPSFTTPTPSAYAQSVLRNIGRATSSSLYPSHALLEWFLTFFPEQFKIDRGAEMHMSIRKRAIKKQHQKSQ